MSAPIELEHLDGIEGLARKQAVAYARMLELDGGVGRLGVQEPEMYQDVLDWGRSTTNEHADQVLALVNEVRRLNAYLSPFQPGDPDPTPNDSEVGACAAKHPDDGNPNRCTWQFGHPDRWSHVAGNGEIVTAVF